MECVRIFRGAHLRPSVQRPGTVDYHALATAAQLAHSAVAFAAPALPDAPEHAAEQHAVTRTTSAAGGSGIIIAERETSVVVALGGAGSDDDDDDVAVAVDDAAEEAEAVMARDALVVKWRAALASFGKALPSSAAAAQSGAVGATLAGSRLAAALEEHPAARAEHRRAWAKRGGALLADGADDDAAIIA